MEALIALIAAQLVILLAERLLVRLRLLVVSTW